MLVIHTRAHFEIFSPNVTDSFSFIHKITDAFSSYSTDNLSKLLNLKSEMFICNISG